MDETEKGWYITLVQRDPAEELAAERRAKRERAEAVRLPTLHQGRNEGALVAVHLFQVAGILAWSRLLRWHGKCGAARDQAECQQRECMDLMKAEHAPAVLHSPSVACRCAQDEAERQRENLTDQIERAAKHARHDEGPAEGTELRRDAEGEPLRLALAAKRLPAREAPAERAAAPAFEAAERDDKVPGTVVMCVISCTGSGVLRKLCANGPATCDAASLAAQAASTSAPRARSKAEELMQRELAAKRGREERANGGGGGGRKDAPWLQTGVIVKVRNAPQELPSALVPDAAR